MAGLFKVERQKFILFSNNPDDDPFYLYIQLKVILSLPYSIEI